MSTILWAVRRRDGAWLSVHTDKILWVVDAPLAATWWSDPVSRRWAGASIVDVFRLKADEEWVARVDVPFRRGRPVTSGQVWEAVLRQVAGFLFSEEEST